MLAETVKQRIESALPGAQVVVESPDGRHFSASVVAKEFDGKTMIQQHRMIYALFESEMESDDLHAFSLKTSSPKS